MGRVCKIHEQVTAATARGLDEATAAIVGRVSGRLEEIVRGMVERYREEDRKSVV